MFKDYLSADDVITFSKNAVVRHYTGRKHKFPRHVCVVLAFWQSHCLMWCGANCRPHANNLKPTHSYQITLLSNSIFFWLLSLPGLAYVRRTVGQQQKANQASWVNVIVAERHQRIVTTIFWQPNCLPDHHILYNFLALFASLWIIIGYLKSSVGL